MKFHNIEIRTQSFCSTFNFEIMERPNLDGSLTFLKNKPKMQFWNGIMHFFMKYTISVKNVFEKNSNSSFKNKVTYLLKIIICNINSKKYVSLFQIIIILVLAPVQDQIYWEEYNNLPKNRLKYKKVLKHIIS